MIMESQECDEHFVDEQAFKYNPVVFLIDTGGLQWCSTTQIKTLSMRNIPVVTHL